jgi:hypothetical protein
MSLIQLLYGLVAMFLIQQGFAQPPYEVLTSCINSKPLNEKVTLTLLNGGGFSSKSENNCDEPYEIQFKDQKFTYTSCNDRDYLMVADKKLFLDASVNMSANSEIKPEILYPHLSSWMKVDYSSQSYLCISSPLSQSGSGADVPQYYLIENAFIKNIAPIAYYYIFDKNIIPITSHHF